MPSEFRGGGGGRQWNTVLAERNNGFGVAVVLKVEADSGNTSGPGSVWVHRIRKQISDRSVSASAAAAETQTLDHMSLKSVMFICQAIRVPFLLFFLLLSVSDVE